MRKAIRTKLFHVNGLKCSSAISTQNLTSMRSWIALVLTMTLVTVLSAAALAMHGGDPQKTAPRTTITPPEIRKMEKITVAFIRHVRPNPTEGCGPAWDKVMAWANKKGVIDTNTYYLGINYDRPDTTPAGKQRYDACVMVPKGTKGDGDVRIKEIEGGKCAVFLHRGPYQNLEDMYNYIYKTWAPKAKRKVAYALEIYWTPSMKTPPENILTEIRVPLNE